MFRQLKGIVITKYAFLTYPFRYMNKVWGHSFNEKKKKRNKVNVESCLTLAISAVNPLIHDGKIHFQCILFCLIITKFWNISCFDKVYKICHDLNCYNSSMQNNFLWFEKSFKMYIYIFFVQGSLLGNQQ